MFRSVTAAIVGLIGLVVTAPAFAHHAMDGRTPDSLATGLISGLAHPVIGLDHLAFIFAAGLLAAPRSRGLLLPLAFVIASALGSMLHLGGVSLPAGELLVAGSVLLLGVLLVFPRQINDGLFAAILALAGLFHGYAFAESIFGAEQTPLVSYLAGLAVMEYAIAAGTVLIWRLLSRRNIAMLPQLSRLAGVGVAVVGAVFLALNIAG
ncbi:MAG: HupE/UreJ family protein [Ferrovibrio sp.]|uniref:HupE/UreJ family protein n=1 Tax=Ferrovibrio sp. TaxID=1917215 RepID=UPI002625AD82|nr:HupE/UreJ family protein [Ferrovibrio sp.]MCW0235992.1 HupE/UreJ family protein [Ferrovibrio sp.]